MVVWNLYSACLKLHGISKYHTYSLVLIDVSSTWFKNTAKDYENQTKLYSSFIRFG